MPTVPAGARRVAIIAGGLVLLAIIIVAITDTTDQQTADATGWRHIVTCSGDAAENTERFMVGDEWAVYWSADASEYRTGYFSLTLYTAAGKYKALLASRIRGGAETVYQHESGVYYLEIDSSGPWSVQVWDKR